MRKVPVADLEVQDSPIVQNGLEYTCLICQAKPGVFCNDIISGGRLHDARGRWVHIGRAEMGDVEWDV